MSITSDLRTYLISLPIVAAMVGTRVRPDVLAEGDAYPGITISVDSEDHQNDLDGDGGLVFASVDITTWATVKQEAENIANQLRLALSGVKGVVGSQTIDAVLESSDVEFVPHQDGSDGGAWAKTQRWFISFSETVAYP